MPRERQAVITKGVAHILVLRILVTVVVLALPALGSTDDLTRRGSCPP
jgi:hypothetical protein